MGIDVREAAHCRRVLTLHICRIALNGGSELAILGTAINEPISPADVDSCHRVPTKDKTRSNTVQFQNRAIRRDAVLQKAQKSRLSTTDIGFTLPAAAVYVNEHLCPEQKKLLGMTVARKKEKNSRYAWTKGGIFFARKTDSLRTFRVTRVSDLEKIASGYLIPI